MEASENRKEGEEEQFWIEIRMGKNMREPRQEWAGIVMNST